MKPEIAETIIETGGFKGRKKKINEGGEGNVVSASLSWWSPIFSINDRDLVRNTLGGAIQPFLGQNEDLENLKSQFATSDAFIPQRQAERYGKSYFNFGINELSQHYENYVGGGELQYKILGTFAYKAEVMHVVLVCSQANGAGQFAAYLLVPEEDINNEAVVTRDAKGNWVWKPQTTETTIRRLEAHSWQNYPMYRRWEHVAFAFHIPDELGNQINVPDLDKHLIQL